MYCARRGFDDDLQQLVETGSPADEATEAIKLLEWFRQHPIPGRECMRNPEYEASVLFLRREISKLRLDALRNAFPRPQPYNHPALMDLHLEPDFMVPANEFNWTKDAPCRNGYVFQVLPPTPDVDSMHWATQDALEIAHRGARLHIRLDPFLCEEITHYDAPCIKLKTHGKQFNWGWVDALREPHPSAFASSPPQSEYLKTELVWSPRNDGIHFECEELPDDGARSYMGARYCHAVYRHGGTIAHADGALRIYDAGDHSRRMGAHLQHFSKIGIQVKVFSIDGTINRDAWCDLVSSYFVRNLDVKKYFSG